MSAPFEGNEGIDNSGNGTYGDGGAGQQQGTNPSWNELLSIVPQELHQQVTPILSSWDKGVNERFQKVHSEYEPWKEIRNGADPETAKWGLNVINQIQNDPVMVYEALAQYMKDQGIQLPGQQQDQQQGLPTGQGQQGPDNLNPYEQQIQQVQQQLQQVQEANRLMTDYLQMQQQNSTAAQADAEVNQQFDAAKEKYGLSPMDEHTVANLVLTNPKLSIEDAAKQVYDHNEAMAKNFRPKPLIMGAGGGLPGGVQPQQMNSTQTKSLVVQMLEAAKAQNQ